MNKHLPTHICNKAQLSDIIKALRNEFSHHGPHRAHDTVERAKEPLVLIELFARMLGGIDESINRLYEALDHHSAADHPRH